MLTDVVSRQKTEFPAKKPGLTSFCHKIEKWWESVAQILGTNGLMAWASSLNPILPCCVKVKIVTARVMVMMMMMNNTFNLKKITILTHSLRALQMIATK